MPEQLPDHGEALAKPSSGGCSLSNSLPRRQFRDQLQRIREAVLGGERDQAVAALQFLGAAVAIHQHDSEIVDRGALNGLKALCRRHIDIQ